MAPHAPVIGLCVTISTSGDLSVTDIIPHSPAGRSVPPPHLSAEACLFQGAILCREIGILLPNNQRQHRALHIQKDVLPCALC